MSNDHHWANAFETYKRQIDVLDSIRDITHMENINHDIPRIVVISVQSVGKSSVIRALSNVELPIGDSLCTRCPCELRLRTSELTSHSCEIPTRGLEFDIENVEDIEKTVLKATMMMTKQPDGEFVDAGMFSSDEYIVLNLKSPQCPTVTMIDLPGIFSERVGQEAEAAQLVKTMAKDYISKDDTLILHVVRINDDIQTLNTWRMVNDASSDGARIVTVMTKPDIGDIDINLKRVENLIKSEIVGTKAFLLRAVDDGSDVGWLPVGKSHLLEITGRSPLINYLSRHLQNEIRASFPILTNMIRKEIGMTKNKLISIGRKSLNPIEALLLNEY